jgi:hypothetical protein
MSQRFIVPFLAVLLWATASNVAFAHERYYEFDRTHFALSIERFMGVDYTDFEGPGGDKVTGRFLLNASEVVPTNIARFGFDVFLGRLSLGLAGGVTTDDVGIIAPRVGYLFGLTPQIGLWLRGGAFYAHAGTSYFGITGEALFGFFPYPNVAITLGPTLDVAFAEDPRPGYVSIGLPQLGMTAWL